jgi:hypothetical protein
VAVLGRGDVDERRLGPRRERGRPENRRAGDRSEKGLFGGRARWRNGREQQEQRRDRAAARAAAAALAAATDVVGVPLLLLRFLAEDGLLEEQGLDSGALSVVSFVVFSLLERARRSWSRGRGQEGEVDEEGAARLALVGVVLLFLSFLFLLPQSGNRRQPELQLRLPLELSRKKNAWQSLGPQSARQATRVKGRAARRLFFVIWGSG